MARCRFELTDDPFEQIEDLLPEVEGRGRPYEDHQLVNSPRTGICGYEGPATPPY
jgi:hypothetical protein